MDQTYLYIIAAIVVLVIALAAAYEYGYLDTMLPVKWQKGLPATTTTDTFASY
jgi:hypothetical protein